MSEYLEYLPSPSGIVIRNSMLRVFKMGLNFKIDSFNLHTYFESIYS